MIQSTLRRTLLGAGLAVSLALIGCRHTRTDDVFEPNDDATSATLLTLDTPIVARANQWNADVFAFEPPHSAAAFLVTLESLGLEECAGVTVQDPEHRIVFQTEAGCNARAEPLVQERGVTLQRSRADLVITVPVELPGAYLITVLEGGEADNVFDFSWDYRLTASAR